MSVKLSAVISVMIGLFLSVQNPCYAQPGDPGGLPGGFPHLSPPYQLFTVSYDEDMEELFILFHRPVAQAEVFIYKDGCLVDSEQVTNVPAGTTLSYLLPCNGAGIYTAYLRISDTIYTLFYREFE